MKTYQTVREQTATGINPCSITVHHLDQVFDPRAGLEGPFRYHTGSILYYNARLGLYLDPLRDLYLTPEAALYAMGVTETKPEQNYK
jgi:hypothetical protein